MRSVQGVRGCNAGTDLDSLLAKMVARGRDLAGATQRVVRVLWETRIGNEEGGAKTNMSVLVRAVAHAE